MFCNANCALSEMKHAEYGKELKYVANHKWLLKIVRFLLKKTTSCLYFFLGSTFELASLLVSIFAIHIMFHDKMHSNMLKNVY